MNDTADANIVIEVLVQDIAKLTKKNALLTARVIELENKSKEVTKDGNITTISKD